MFFANNDYFLGLVEVMENVQAKALNFIVRQQSQELERAISREESIASAKVEHGETLTIKLVLSVAFLK